MMGESSIDRLPLTHTPAGDRTLHPGLCDVRESNLPPFPLRDSANQATPVRAKSSFFKSLLDFNLKKSNGQKEMPLKHIKSKKRI